MDRSEVLEYVKEKYSVLPDYPWLDEPDYAVFRNPESKKWFGLLFPVKAKHVIEDGGEGFVDILNLKGTEELVDFFSAQPGYARGYHMNKKLWLTVILSEVTIEEVSALIDESYHLVEKKKGRK